MKTWFYLCMKDKTTFSQIFQSKIDQLKARRKRNNEIFLAIIHKVNLNSSLSQENESHRLAKIQSNEHFHVDMIN